MEDHIKHYRTHITKAKDELQYNSFKHYTRNIINAILQYACWLAFAVLIWLAISIPLNPISSTTNINESSKFYI